MKPWQIRHTICYAKETMSKLITWNNKGESKMKKLPTQIIEVDNEGLISLLGQKITVFCLNYIYSGTLEGVNDKVIKLNNASIVYETGAFTDSKFKDAQLLPNAVYINLNTIESFTQLKANQ